MVERGEGHPQPDPGGLVHLAVDEGRLLDDPRFLHLDPEVGALAGALPHPGEDRHPAVVGGHPVDHLLDEHRLADAGTAEQPDLPALHVRLEEVDDLDAGLEHDRPRLEGVEGGGRSVDLPVVLDLADRVGVERLAEDVEDVAEHRVAHRHPEPPSEIAHLGAAGEAVGRPQADTAHPAVADLLGGLGGDDLALAFEHDVDFDRAVDLGQGVGRELHVDDRPGDGHHPAGGQRGGLAG